MSVTKVRFNILFMFAVIVIKQFLIQETHYNDISAIKSMHISNQVKSYPYISNTLITLVSSLNVKNITVISGISV